MQNDSNLYSHFAACYADDPGRELLTTGDGAVWHYADVDALASQFAAALAGLGARPGDRISVQVGKSPEALALYLASLKAGFVFHPLNPAYKQGEVEFFLGDAEPAIAVCDPRDEGWIAPLAAGAGALHTLTLDAEGQGTLTERAAAELPDFEALPRGSDDLAALLYSSGTTGVPKGIMLTHGNLLSNTETLVSAWGFTASDRLLHALPIFHVHGLFVAIGCVMASGASMRWLRGFDAAEIVRYLPECSVMMGVPTYYTRLLAAPTFTRETASRARLFVSGSAPLLEETFVAFEARTGHRILERYGMTETNMNTSNPLDGERKPGTVGPPLPGVEARITDDAGRVLPAGEIGNLEVRGPNVFVGYWKLPEKTAEDFTADRFFRTGDKGVIDEDGYVAIVGRAKDVVITGGLNVYPKEVERFIDELPGVRESAVIGVPHPDFGEAVVAVVVRAGTRAGSAGDRAAAAAGAGADDEAKRIVAACKAGLADFKVPKRVLFVDELPRNTMAKVQKNRLREQHEALFTAARSG